MYNARKNPKITRSKESSYKSNCSCPNDFQFKKDQSKFDKHKKNSLEKTVEENEKFLHEELRKYGLAPKTKKAPERKHYNSPKGGRIDINLKSVPEDRIIKVNIKEILRTNRYKSKTEPNLASQRYVDDLKKEIKAKKREIPLLPDKYKKKYVKSLKDELFLNKLTAGHDKNQQIEEIKKEIETYRSQNSDGFQPTKFNITIHHKKKTKRDVQEEDKSGRKKRSRRGKNSEAGDGHDRSSETRKADRKRTEEILETSAKSECAEEEAAPRPTPVKYVSISTQCEVETIRNVDGDSDAKRREVFEDLLPKISSVIEKTEKKLEREIQKVFRASKTVQERGVSPIKEIIRTSVSEEIDDDKPYTPPNTPRQSGEPSDVEKSPVKTAQSEAYSPPIGNLLVNIQNIKDSRCLLDGFQNELQALKGEIESCRGCMEGRDFCDKHVEYTPLLKLGEVGSKNDQINLYNALKTEVYLKRELENQIQRISNLERKLSKVKRSQNEDKIKEVEDELRFAKSYFENLLIKQQNERLLKEQQKLMKGKTLHDCSNIEDCDKCNLDRQISELLAKVRNNIAEDIENSKRRLKVQKMPVIDIRKPLQLQNILKLDIPPSAQQKIFTKRNFAYEAVVTEQEDLKEDEGTQTKIEVKESPSFEVKFKKVKKKDEKDKRKREKSLEKTPSELGFRSNVATQCDSNASLAEPRKNGIPAQTQTAGKDDSFYLFGFREYLLKNSRDSASSANHADVNLQVSMEESVDSVVECRSVGVNTEVTKKKSCEFSGVTGFASPASEEVEEEIPVKFPKELMASQGNSRNSRSLQRIPSLKKMFLPPSKTSDGGRPTELESTLQNPYTEPKYKMKRFSVTKQESEMETRPQPADDYYKSLIEKEELPERKAAVLVDTQPPKTEDTSLIEQKTYSDNSSKDKPKETDGDQDTEDFAFSQEVRKSVSRELAESQRIQEYFLKKSSFGRSKSGELHQVEEEKPETQVEEPKENEKETNKVEIKDELPYIFVLKAPEQQARMSRKKSMALEPEYLEDVEMKVGQKQVEIQEQPTQLSDKNEEDSTDGSTPIFMEHREEDNRSYNINEIQDETNKEEKPASTKQVTVIQQEPNEDRKVEMAETTVLSLVQPKYKLVLNKGKDSKTSNILLRFPIPETTKSLKKIEPLRINVEPRKISDITNKYLIAQPKKKVTNVTNYILHEPPNPPCKSNVANLTKERLEYAEKVKNLDTSIESSSVLSSEGEVKCKCKNISSGEVHSCPRGGAKVAQPGIQYKKNVSSHVILENERKHYNHWVTYYATKKKVHDSSSSSVESGSVKDD